MARSTAGRRASPRSGVVPSASPLSRRRFRARVSRCSMLRGATTKARAISLFDRSDNRGEGKGRTLSAFERGMTTRKEEPQQLVFEAAKDIGLGDRDARPWAQLGENGHCVPVALRSSNASLPVTVSVLRHRHQPCLRRMGQPSSGPRRQRALDRVVDRILGIDEGPRESQEFAEDFWVRPSDHVGVGRNGQGRHRQLTGRTSMKW